MSITDFLNARIAEDEAMARVAIDTQAPDEWENPTQTQNHYPADIAFWDRVTPARVLAECAAKRAIVELHQPYELVQRMAHGDIYPCMTCGSVDDSPEPFPCDTLRTLAAVYADHEDYRGEWRVGV